MTPVGSPLARSPGYVLPCRTKTAPSTRKQALFLLFLCILLGLVFIKLGDTEERNNEYDQVNR